MQLSVANEKKFNLKIDFSEEIKNNTFQNCYCFAGYKQYKVVFQKSPMGNNCKINTSLTFEVLLYLNSYYFGLFAVCELGMNGVKYINFDDLPHFSTDFGVLIALCVVEIFRIIVARRGNLTEKKLLIILAILLTIPSVVGVLYLMIWQSYVLRFEYIICTIQLGLCVVEIVTGILCLFPCCKVPEYY